MNIITNKKIAIVGGGPGGLTLARLLQQKGAAVSVYERDLHKDVRVQGATLDLHEESGLKALEEAGLMNAFKSNYRPGADKMRIADKHGMIVYDEPVAAPDELFRPEIDRGPLRKILLDSLEPDTVVWNSYLVSLTKTDGCWKLAFENGTSVTADIVVAADGARSCIRPYLTSIQPFYTGITVVEGTVYDAAKTAPQMHDMLQGGKIFALGDGQTLIVSSKGDGSMVFYTGCATTENWWRESGIDFHDKKQVRSWFQQEFAGWESCWLELFDQASVPFIPRPQYCMPSDQRWDTLPDLTMLGDAAHLMPPYAGEGVNMAMLDALELSRCLTDETFPDTRSTLAAFEQQMCARAGATATMTLEQTASMHSSGGLAQMLEMFGG